MLNNPVRLVDPDGRTTLVFWVTGPGINHSYLSSYSPRGEITLSVKGDYPGADVTLGDGTVGLRAALKYVESGHTVTMFEYSLTDQQENTMFDYLQNLPHGGVSLDHPQAFVNEAFPICSDHVSRAFAAASVDISSWSPGAVARDLLADDNAAPIAVYEPGKESERMLGGLISAIEVSDPLQVVSENVVRVDGVLKFVRPE